MKNNKGFMLAETLIITTFVAGVLIFLFIQFNNLSNNYTESHKYNTVEGLYSLKNIRNYLLTDVELLDKIQSTIDYNTILDITDCNYAGDKKYCLLLFELENIEKILISKNKINIESFQTQSEDIKYFANKISITGDEKYRMVVKFKDNTYATIRFGD